MSTPAMLCAVDFSDCSKRALRYAASLSAQFGAHLTVLHVVDPVLVSEAALHQMEVFSDDGRAELHQFVDNALSQASLRPGPVELMLTMGSPGWDIVSVSNEMNVDLIVIGTHGSTGFRRALLGSTARGVLRRARKPVLTVPLSGNRQTDIESTLRTSGAVLTPVDFSSESKAAVKAAAVVARTMKRQLLLLHVASPSSSGATWRDRSAVLGGRTVLGNSSTLLADLATSVDSDLDVHNRLAIGDPAEEIVRVAGEVAAGVIVMRLRHMTARMLGARAGSVAHRVLCLAPTPILALPPGPPRGAQTATLAGVGAHAFNAPTGSAV